MTSCGEDGGGGEGRGEPQRESFPPEYQCPHPIHLYVSAEEMATCYKKSDRCLRRLSEMKIKQTIVKIENQADPRRRVAYCALLRDYVRLVLNLTQSSPHSEAVHQIKNC